MLSDAAGPNSSARSGTPVSKRSYEPSWPQAALGSDEGLSPSRSTNAARDLRLAWHEHPVSLGPEISLAREERIRTGRVLALVAELALAPGGVGWIFGNQRHGLPLPDAVEMDPARLFGAPRVERLATFGEIRQSVPRQACPPSEQGRREVFTNLDALLGEQCGRPRRFTGMGKLMYVTNVTLDGYIEDEHGTFDLFPPSEEVFASTTELVTSTGTFLYGRQLYETMAVWETEPALAAQSELAAEFATAWQSAEKVVYSASLTTSSTRTEHED